MINIYENLAPDCELNNYGILTIENKSSNPYNIYANNNFWFTISGYGTQIFDNLQIGTYYLKAVQKSGYAFYATENIRTVNFTYACQEITITIGYED